MVTVLLAVVAALAVGCVAAVLGLRRQVHRLETEVAALRTIATAEVSSARRPARNDAKVPVITCLPAPGAPTLPDPTFGRAVSVTAAGPLMKLAALSFGMRRALDEESRMRIGYAFRRELRRQRRLQRQ